MAQSFIARADGRFMCALEPDERAVIVQVATEVAELIRADLGLSSGGGSGHLTSDDPLARLEAEDRLAEVREPSDAAVRRLFPDASVDEEHAREFRAFSQHTLALGHIANLATMRAALEAHADFGDVGSSEITVSRDDALAWLKALSVIRVVLGERMDLQGDSDFEALQLLCHSHVDLGESSASHTAGIEFLAALYEFLSWLQESLVMALNSRG